MKSLTEIITVIFHTCAQFQRGEKILIIADQNTRELAENFLSVATTITNNPTLSIIPVGTLDGEEPPLTVAKIMPRYNIIIELTTTSLTHTNATKAALHHRAKVISMPAVTVDIVKKYILVNYQKMKKITVSLAELLNKTNTVKIKNKAGTDLTVDVKDQLAMPLYGICDPGKFINLPDGEALISPTSAHGTLVIDGSMPPDTNSKWGIIGKIKDPIILTIKDGMIIDIKGKNEAQVLKKVYQDFPASAKKIAEFAIGTNLAATIVGNITVDEKANQTAHIAFGNSCGIGGTNNVPIHLDGVFQKPTIWFDQRLVMKEGILFVD